MMSESKCKVSDRLGQAASAHPRQSERLSSIIDTSLTRTKAHEEACSAMQNNKLQSDKAQAENSTLQSDRTQAGSSRLPGLC